MAQVKVKAKATGYYEHRRIREGSVFFMDDKLIKTDKDGVVISPRWIELYDQVAKKKKKGHEVVEEIIIEEVIDNDEVI